MIKKNLFWITVLILMIAVSSCEESDTNENKSDVTTGEVTDGYILYTYIDDYTTHLIDTAGNDLKTWTSSYEAAGVTYLSDQLTLLRAGTTTAAETGTFQGGGAPSGIIEELDDESNVIWSFQRDDDSCTLHHDFKEIDENTIIATAWKLVEYDSSEYWDELVLIIDKTTSTVTWEWSAIYDGGILPDESDDSGANPGDGYGSNPGDSTGNGPGGDNGFNPGDSTGFNPGDSTGNGPGNNPGSGFGNSNSGNFIHLNSVDYKDGSILLSSRYLNTLYVVDEESKEITATYTADGYLNSQHDATFLDNGNILVFNNEASNSESAVVEINSSDEVVWEYSNDFYSSFVSGAQRLESGNTLICVGSSGQLLEVTSDGELVWDYTPESTSSNTTRRDIFKVHEYTEY